MNRTTSKTLAVAIIVFSLSACRENSNDAERIPMAEMVSAGIEISLNPNGITPLAAALTLETEYASEVEYKVLGNRPVEGGSMDAMQRHENIPIVGLYESTKNFVELKVTDSRGKVAYDTLEIDTDSAYVGNPHITINLRNEALREPGMYLADLHFGTTGFFNSRPAVFDADGKIRYQLDLSGFGTISWPLKRLSNGHFFFVNGGHLYEYSLLGEELNDWSLGSFHAHHDFTEMPNGHLLIIAYRDGKNIQTATGSVQSVEDQIIEFDPSTNSILHEWDLTQLLDVDRTDLQDGGADWFHANSVFYDETDQSVIVSGRNQGVIKMDWNNSLKWILAPHQGWGNAGPQGAGSPTSDYLLTAVDGNGDAYPDSIQSGVGYSGSFDWPFAQHCANVLPNGHLLLFDNGFNRRLDPNILLVNRYSRIVEYDIHATNKTVSQVWEWGKAQGFGLYSVIISSAYQLPQTGNYLLGSGFIMATTPLSARVIELAGATKTPAFEAELSFKNATGNGVFGWGTIDIMYRVTPFSF